MVGGGGVWLWWAYRTYDICTLLSLQYLGREGGGGFGRWARPRGENGGSTNSQLVQRLRRRGPSASS